MKKINIVLFGVGNVGSTLINQILKLNSELKGKGELELNLPVVLNSTIAFFEKKGVGTSWEADFIDFGVPYKLQDIIDYVKKNEYENLIAVDATASEELVQSYGRLIQNGFHIVAANKIANTLSSEFYDTLRQELLVQNRHFLYETNVGAGLPVVETLKSLHAAGEKVTKVRGVFSGSLSYIFNTFSEGNKTFDSVITEAGEKGFTEPDPRVDLSGKDVARKLLILARELNLRKELHEIKIQDLVPVHLNGSSSRQNFIENLSDLNTDFEELRKQLDNNEVLRHIGELDVSTGELEVKLEKEKKTSPFGSLQHADASFEIYTESYGSRPLVIQGAGAGAAVTARGVLSDILKLSEKLI
jgi:homoserine dehydrogenase